MPRHVLPTLTVGDTASTWGTFAGSREALFALAPIDAGRRWTLMPFVDADGELTKATLVVKTPRSIPPQAASIGMVPSALLDGDYRRGLAAELRIMRATASAWRRAHLQERNTSCRVT